jgi:recombination protein RecA
MRRSKRDETGEERPARLIDAVVQHIRQSEGEESSILTGEVAGAKDYLSTQNLALDLALNMPGIPVGRLTVVRGWESSGKTSLATHLLAETAQRGGVPILLDAEFAFDESRAARLGLAREDLLIAQPETMEEAIRLVEKSIKAVREEAPDALATIVWDSVGGTQTKAESEGEFGVEGQAIGQGAKIMSAALKRIIPIVAKENIVLVIVNQNKENIQTGMVRGGDTSTMVAKHPLQFHASTIIDMRKAQELRRGDKDSPAYGIMARAKVSKNKCSNPFGKAEIRVTFDYGFDDDHAHFQAAVKLGMIQKKGSWFKMADVDESFHETDFHQILADTPGLRERIAVAAREEFWTETVRKRFPEVA